MVGSRVMFGHHARAIAAFVSANHTDLEAMPTAFFSVGSIGPAGAPRDGMLRELGWNPLETAAFPMFGEPAMVAAFTDRFRRDVDALAVR
jgi:flavodoxin-like protein